MVPAQVCFLLRSFQNFSSFAMGKDLLIEERAGERGILVEDDYDQSKSLFSHRLCIGHVRVSLAEKQSSAKGCPRERRLLFTLCCHYHICRCMHGGR